MSRNTFGNMMVGLFVLLVFMVFVHNERHQQGMTAPALFVVLPALYRTIVVLGAIICAIRVVLRFAKKSPPRNW